MLALHACMDEETKYLKLTFCARIIVPHQMTGLLTQSTWPMLALRPATTCCQVIFRHNGPPASPPLMQIEQHLMCLVCGRMYTCSSLAKCRWRTLQLPFPLMDGNKYKMAGSCKGSLVCNVRVQACSGARSSLSSVYLSMKSETILHLFHSTARAPRFNLQLARMHDSISIFTFEVQHVPVAL